MSQPIFMCQSEYIKQNNFKFRPKKYMCSRNLKEDYYSMSHRSVKGHDRTVNS